MVSYSESYTTSLPQRFADSVSQEITDANFGEVLGAEYPPMLGELPKKLRSGESATNSRLVEVCLSARYEARKKSRIGFTQR